jgi:uncharacterized protein YceK
MTKNFARITALVVLAITLQSCASIYTHAMAFRETYPCAEIRHGYFPGSLRYLHASFYAGVKLDYEVSHQCSRSGKNCHEMAWGNIPFVLIDMPFSLVADTLFIPYQYVHAWMLGLNTKVMWRTSDSWIDQPVEARYCR